MEWLNTALNKRLFSAALHAICFKYNCMIKIGITILKYLSGRVCAFCVRGPQFNACQGIPFICRPSSAAIAAFTFFPCGQSTFMQCFSVALNTCLTSATVHAGKENNIGL